MVFQPLDVFQKEGRRLFGVNDPYNVIKECSLSWVVKTLSTSDRAEGLTREARKQNIKVGNVLGFYLGDVSMWNLTEVRCVGLLRVLVPFGTEYA